MPRRPGSLNRRTLELKERIEAKFPGWDPVEQLAAVAQDETAPIELRVQCARDVTPYLWPRLKALEVESGQGLHLTLNAYLSALVAPDDEAECIDVPPARPALGQCDGGDADELSGE